MITEDINTLKQAVAELGHTRIPSCQLGQCSDQVEPDRVRMVLVSKRNFLKVYVKYFKLWVAFMAIIQDSKFCLRTDGLVSENNATGGPNSSADTELM